jgi:hypothetical protein
MPNTIETMLSYNRYNVAATVTLGCYTSRVFFLAPER